MKKGFTLAEVLITLGIIGVIAAMTMPTLSTNIKKQQAGPSLLTSINLLEQANKTAMNDLNVRKLSSACNEDYLTCITPYLNGSNYTNNEPYREFNGSAIQASRFGGVLTGLNALLLNNGTSIINYESSSYTSGVNSVSYYKVLIDTDGPNKGPNTLGKDLFMLTVNKSTGETFAFGSNAYLSDIQKAIGSTSEILWTTACNSNKVSDGRFCAGSIVDNGGKVIYPW